MHDPLERLLALYPSSARPNEPPTPLGNAGGLSGARLWRFDSGLGPLVARAWPIDGPGEAVLARIHGWLARLVDLDFIPIPLQTRDGRTLVHDDGRWWEVAPWRPGAAEAGRPPAPARLRAGFAGLAAVHQRLVLDATTAPSPGLRSRLAEADDLLGSGLDLIETAARSLLGDPASTPALRWIALARDGLPRLAERLRRCAATPLPIQPTLRDARPEHFLFKGDRLTGLVDFGAMGLESPASDLARLLSEWVGEDRATLSAALDAYDAVRPLSPSESGLIDVFAESAAWLGPSRWARWHFLDRRSFDDPDAVRRGLDRGLERIAGRALRS